MSAMMAENGPATTMPIFFVRIAPRVVSSPGDLAAVAPDAGDLAVLDDVACPWLGAGARIAPGHRVMPRRAAARLVEAPRTG